MGLLEARSPIVAMVTSPLSEAQTARLAAAELDRLRSEHVLLECENDILMDLWDAEHTRNQAARDRPRENLRGAILELISASVMPSDETTCSNGWQRGRYLVERVAEVDREMRDISDQIYRIERAQGLPSERDCTCPTCQQNRLLYMLEDQLQDDDYGALLDGHQDFENGDVLSRQGEHGDTLYVIRHGAVSCTQRSSRCKVGPARAALWERLTQRPSALVPSAASRRALW